MGHRSRVPDALHDVLVAEGRIPPPRRTFRLSDVQPGWDVVDNRDAWVGTVEAVREEYLVVRRGFLVPTLYVPLRGLGQVREDVVALNVPAAWVGELGWEQPPRSPAPHASPRPRR